MTCVFRKRAQNKYLVVCETRENKRILQNYTKILDEIKRKIVFITSDDVFVMGKDFMRLKIKTDDVLPYNKKIKISVCITVISSIFEEIECITHKSCDMIVITSMKTVSKFILNKKIK